MPTTRKRTTRGAPKTSKGKTAPSGAKKISEVMTPDPVAMIETETIQNAAKAMCEHDIGDVIVLDDTSARIKGIVTDRDVVVRALAEGMDPSQTTLASIVSDRLVCVAPNDSVDKALRFMRDRALRRLPVVEGDEPVGFVSIGDLALELDKQSALAEISAAPANN